MNLLCELGIYVNTLAEAIKSDKKGFFDPVKYHIIKLQEKLSCFSEINRKEIAIHQKEIESFFAKYRPSPCEPGSFPYIPPVAASNNDDTVKEINRIVEEILNLDDEKYNNLFNLNSATLETCLKNKADCIFIGHGRSEIYKEVASYLKDELNLDKNKILYFESEDRTSQHIVDVLKDFLNKAYLAILVMTAEDETSTDKVRARQNVIHEIGLFQGRLGFDKVIILKQDGIEEFSNVAGLQYIPFTGKNIEYNALKKLKEKLKREKLII